LNINEYISLLESTVHSFKIITSYNLNIDRKSEDIAFISGKVEFRDGSLLDLKEFIESNEFGIIKYKYGYNYRIASEIIFRYDNAPDPSAKILKTFPHHKHIKNKVVESKEMDLSEILNEIEVYIFNK
jgi:hypothetical protein